MSAENFLDSNVIVYLFDETNPVKRQRAERLVHQNVDNEAGCISHQVVQESLNVLSRALSPSSDELARLIDEILFPLWQVYPTRELYRRGLLVQARYRFSFYDSLIVAAVLEAGCTTLYSEDMQDGQRIEGLTIRNPFVELGAH
jgi:predicted nucleic acid-binding protein